MPKHKLRYWLTVHWPPSYDPENDAAPDAPEGVYVPKGREEAADGLQSGDRVLVYQTITGPMNLDEYKKGFRLRRGRGGVVADLVVTRRLRRRIWWPSHYHNAPSRKWSRIAYTEADPTPIDAVPRKAVNRVLGYSPGYEFRGFGRLHAGLDEIERDQYLELCEKLRAVRVREEKQAKKKARKILRRRKPRPGHLYDGRGGGESKLHRDLKLAIGKDPNKILQLRGLSTEKVEYRYSSGDRVDILLINTAGHFVPVEVEPVVTDANCLVPVLQAVKYAILSDVEAGRKLGHSRPIIAATSISAAAVKLAGKYGVRTIEVPRSRFE